MRVRRPLPWVRSWRPVLFAMQINLLHHCRNSAIRRGAICHVEQYQNLHGYTDLLKRPVCKWLVTMADKYAASSNETRDRSSGGGTVSFSS